MKDSESLAYVKFRERFEANLSADATKFHESKLRKLFTTYAEIPADIFVSGEEVAKCADLTEVELHFLKQDTESSLEWFEECFNEALITAKADYLQELASNEPSPPRKRGRPPLASKRREIMKKHYPFRQALREACRSWLDERTNRLLPLFQAFDNAHVPLPSGTEHKYSLIFNTWVELHDAALRDSSRHRSLFKGLVKALLKTWDRDENQRRLSSQTE